MSTTDASIPIFTTGLGAVDVLLLSLQIFGGEER